MKYEIDEADLDAWREKLYSNIGYVDNLYFGLEYDGDHVTGNDLEELSLALAAIRDSIGVAVENSREAKSN